MLDTRAEMWYSMVGFNNQTRQSGASLGFPLAVRRPSLPGCGPLNC